MEINGEHLSKGSLHAQYGTSSASRGKSQCAIDQGVPLTWRLLHAIGAEAVADLGFAGRYEAALRELFARPDDFPFPETDDIVDIATSGRVATCLFLRCGRLRTGRATRTTAARRRPLSCKRAGLPGRHVLKDSSPTHIHSCAPLST